jgi:integrase
MNAATSVGSVVSGSTALSDSAVTANEAGHVFAAAAGIDRHATRIAALIDPGFLTEVGWDPTLLVLAPPPGHRLLGRPVCRAEGCSTTAPNRARICTGCRRRLAEHGLGDDEVASLPVREQPLRGPGACVVDGCAREWVSSRVQLCRSHGELRHRLGITVAQLSAHRLARPLPGCGPCAVAACPRQRRHRDGVYCEAHQLRLREVRRRDPGVDEHRWRASEPAVGRGGEVSLRGLPALVIAQVLFGLQQRCRLDAVKTNAVKTKEAELRAFCNELRRQQVATIGDHVLATAPDGSYQAVVNSLITHAGRALSTPDTEIVKDQWDLVVFGHSGTLSFTEISQGWLRAVAKRWAADDLPKRRVRAGRRTSAGLAVRHHMGAVARLSESLRARPDRGEHPAALGRIDMDAFLNRLAFLESAGRISGDARIRACREVRQVLSRIRAMGLTRPGAPAAGLGEDCTLGVTDIPAEPEPPEPGRDLPPEIMRQVCAHLDALTSPQIRTGIELAIDTGRRPEEIATLRFDCLARDADGLPVLVYDNHKAHRPGRRLPINEHTAALITTQQHRVRARYPHTPVGELTLLPTDRRNPDGRNAITGFSLAFAHRAWIDRLPVLHTADGTEFDKSKIVLYAYRHTYAQRHADAGVGIDVLRELMSHRKLDTTKQYYRVGHERRREAVDRVAAMQFDRHGNRIWRQAQALLDSEHARRGIGEVAVPFGVCAEPSNVAAGGHACPFRFRCAGCDHFRTDVSYLPDLHAYLEDLLRNRERLLATSGLDDWARAEATPSEEEIGRIRRLISRISTGLEELTPDEREQIAHAVTVVRRHRTVTLGMPRVRQVLPDLRPERTA